MIGINVNSIGKKYLLKYESRIYFNIKKKYNITKQEYCKILKALNKVKY